MKTEKSVKRKMSKAAAAAVIFALCAAAAGAGFAIKAVCDYSRYKNALQSLSANDIEIEYNGSENRISANDLISAPDENSIAYKVMLAKNGESEYVLPADSPVGEYDAEMIAELSENMFFKQIELRAKITLQDTTPPEWTKTTQSVTVYTGESIDIQSLFEAEDISGEVTISAQEEINTDKASSKAVKITAADKYGNTADFELNVNVKEKPTANTSYSSSQNNKKGNNSSSSGGNSSSNKSSNNSTKSNNSTSSGSGSTSGGNSSSESTHKHSIGVGNIGKWFNSRSELISYYNSVAEQWNNKWINGLVGNEEYYANCPSGYECWSCGTCGMWSGNFKYTPI